MLALEEMIITTILKKITTILDFLRYLEDLLDTSLVSLVHHSQSQHSSSGPGIRVNKRGGGVLNIAVLARHVEKFKIVIDRIGNSNQGHLLWFMILKRYLPKRLNSANSNPFCLKSQMEVKI